MLSFWCPDQQNCVIGPSSTRQPSNEIEKADRQTGPVCRVLAVWVGLQAKLGKRRDDKREIEVMWPKVGGR